MEGNGQSTDCCSVSKMQAEIEELKKARQIQEKEFKALVTKKGELLKNNSEQSRLIREIRQQHLTERRQWEEELQRRKKQKEEQVAYYRNHFQFLLAENKVLTQELHEVEYSPSEDSRIQKFSRCPSTSRVGDQRMDDEKRLEKFLSDYRPFEVECNKEFLVRKLEIVKGFVTRDRARMQAEMKNISEEAMRTEEHQRKVLWAREEQLISSKMEFEGLKSTFSEAFEALVSEIALLRSNLQEKERENLRLRNIDEKEQWEEDSDSGNVVDVDENAMSAKFSSDDGLNEEDCADSTNTPGTSAVDDEDTADASESPTSPIASESLTSPIASESPTSPIASESPTSIAAGTTTGGGDNDCTNTAESNTDLISDGTNVTGAGLSKSGAFISHTTTSLLKKTVEYAKSPKRKANLSDREETSKKIKPSTELCSRDDEGPKDTEPEVNSRIVELEREVSKQNTKLKTATEMLIKQQKALINIIKMDRGHGSDENNYLLPTPGMNQAARQIIVISEVQPLPSVSPITRDEAKYFSSVEEFHYAPFSDAHYAQAYNNPSFLLHIPIGIYNPEHTFCYMNSVLQALANIPSFALTLVCGYDSSEGKLLDAMYQTYKHMWVRRSDESNTNRLPVLTAEEVRNYYAQNRSADFDPTGQHDADEFLGDLITSLEMEVEDQACGGEENSVTTMFRGYTVAPNGTKEDFRILRLSIVDDGIDCIQNALIHHLFIRRPILPEPPTVQVSVIEHSASSTITVDLEENVKIPEDADLLEMLGSIADNQDLDPSEKSTEAISTCEDTGDSCTNLKDDALQEEFPFDINIPGKHKKIFTPQILCVSLGRHTDTYTFNWKVLPAEDLIIPAELVAPDGTKGPTHYKLMSVVQYVPAGPSSGHYYTYVKTGRDYSYMLNDELVTCVVRDDFDLTTFDARSVIFIYTRIPENMHCSTGSYK